MNRVKLYNNDCLIEMKNIPDNSIDMILCDLPYGTTACKWDVVIPFNKYVQIGKKVIYEQEYVFDKMKSGASYKEALEDFLSISKDGLWDNYNRVIKDRGAIVLFGSEPFSSYLRMSNIKQYKYDWVWDKITAKGHLVAKKRPMQQSENICVFSGLNYYPQMIERPKNKIQISYECKRTEIMGGSSKKIEPKIYNTWYPKTILTFKTERGLHSTQKPVALLEYLIKTYTLEGETILDNCMGSGSTGVACVNTNRNFIGIEKDETYFQIAQKRIDEALQDKKKGYFNMNIYKEAERSGSAILQYID